MWNESQNLPFAVETLHTSTITLRANTPSHCSASVVIYFASGSFLLRHSRQSNRSNLLATRLYRYRIISHHMSSTASKRRNTSGGMAGGGSSSNKRGGGLSLHAILSHILVGIGGIYIGLMMGMHTCGPSTTMMTTVDGKGNGGGQQGGVPIPPQEQRQQQEIFVEDTKSKSKTASSTASSEKVKFPESVSKLVMDYATVPRDDFNELLEIGVPMDEVSDKDGMKEVLVLYTDEKTLPFRRKQDKKKDFGPKEGIDAKTALENCHTVRVILQEPAKGNGKRQCIAIVSQWESWHIHKFMRMPKKFDGVQVDVKYPLRYVSRSMQDSGKDNKFPQLKKDTVPSYAGLIEYLTNLDRILGELKPILSDALNQSNHGDKSTTSDVMKKSKSMVVMVCNKGQAHLFHNFVCNARSKGLDLSRIIMFATDKYTVQLCHDLNIHVYYDETIFGDMPETAARRYGDKIFSQMMMAKVYCVHLVMSLGYDVLFQDVDVVWNQNPLEHLNTVESKEWDMMFQDDGSRQARYNPYSPNTGFYFVRNNPLTMYFFGTLLRMGDLISATKSHQAALSALLAEFAGWKGLRVKVWHKAGDTLFPGGVEYHQFKDYMRKMIADEIKPYIFHMSWTQNKDNKKLYFEQMGEWYTQEGNSCNGLNCCLPQANITCHYKDKPSKIPCKNSPPIDKNGRSFWK